VDQLLAFEVDDPGVPLGFRARLARENGWTLAHADRVYDEYRRFLVLAATGADPVTPSDPVDQVWHLHLAYTRSYWDHLCGEVLGRPLHHGPTTGSRADDAHYREQYAATLRRYREVFGAEPPADVWPGVAERFRDPARWQRVDTRAHLVVRRAPVVAGAAAALLVGAATAATAREGAEAGLALLVGVVVVVAVIVAVVVAVSRGRPGRAGAPAGDGAGATAAPSSSGVATTAATTTRAAAAVAATPGAAAAAAGAAVAVGVAAAVGAAAAARPGGRPSPGGRRPTCRPPRRRRRRGAGGGGRRWGRRGPVGA
jgi:hypothetical protein